MVIRDSMFGFEIETKKFNLSSQRPIPPKGYIPFYPDRNNYQCSKCPNCGSRNQEIYYKLGGFKERDIQNLMRAMIRLDNRGRSNHKTLAELFELNLNPLRGAHRTMLKCHTSRYGIGQFSCCGAKVWHDFYESKTTLIPEERRMYYYKPTRSYKNDLLGWASDSH